MTDLYLIVDPLNFTWQLSIVSDLSCLPKYSDWNWTLYKSNKLKFLHPLQCGDLYGSPAGPWIPLVHRWPARCRMHTDTYSLNQRASSNWARQMILQHLKPPSSISAVILRSAQACTLASHCPHDVGVILAAPGDWLRHWWMGAWLPGFRSWLDALLPLPVSNHGLDGVGRSVQCNHCNIDHRS